MYNKPAIDKLAIDFQNRFATIKRAGCDQRGAAMAEYGLLLALVALAAVGILALFGTELVNVFDDATTTLQESGNDPAEGTTP